MELKRTVSESSRCNKVFKRAIEERQYQPGLLTMRYDRKVHFVNDLCTVCDAKGVIDTDGEVVTAETNEFDSKMTNLNDGFSVKCNADKLDDELVENQAKPLLDGELEKLGIIGDEANEHCHNLKRKK